jgi:hypothetical protein
MGTLVENVLSRLIAPIVGVVVDRVFPSGETRENQSYECTPIQEISWKDMDRILGGINPTQLRAVSGEGVQA